MGFQSEEFQRDDSGSYFLEYDLKYPGKIGGVERETLKVYRVNVGNLEASNQKKTDAEKEQAMVTSALRMKPNDVKEIDLCDYIHIRTKVIGFLLEAGQENPQAKEMMGHVS